MTYHLERTLSLPRNRSMAFDRETRFPQKLWDTLNAGGSRLIWWSDDGLSVIADYDRFETHVMKRHPGLVQIATFANFRRQLRWYGFDWQVRENGDFEFTHPCFRRDKPELLEAVVTRRRSGRRLPPGLAGRVRDVSSNHRVSRSSSSSAANARSWSPPHRAPPEYGWRTKSPVRAGKRRGRYRAYDRRSGTGRGRGRPRKTDVDRRLHNSIAGEYSDDDDDNDDDTDEYMALDDDVIYTGLLHHEPDSAANSSFEIEYPRPHRYGYHPCTEAELNPDGLLGGQPRGLNNIRRSSLTVAVSFPDGSRHSVLGSTAASATASATPVYHSSSPVEQCPPHCPCVCHNAAAGAREHEHVRDSSMDWFYSCLPYAPLTSSSATTKDFAIPVHFYDATGDVDSDSDVTVSLAEAVNYCDSDLGLYGTPVAVQSDRC